MKQLFENRERPLYGSAVPMRLGRLADPDIAGYLADRFAQTGRGAGEALGPLLESAQGRPQRAIMLAHHLWEQVPAGASARLRALSSSAPRCSRRSSPSSTLCGGATARPPTRSRCARSSRGTGPRRDGILGRLELEKSTARSAVPARRRRRRRGCRRREVPHRRPALRRVDREGGRRLRRRLRRLTETMEPPR